MAHVDNMIGPVHVMTHARYAGPDAVHPATHSPEVADTDETHATHESGPASTFCMLKMPSNRMMLNIVNNSFIKDTILVVETIIAMAIE